MLQQQYRRCSLMFLTKCRCTGTQKRNGCCLTKMITCSTSRSLRPEHIYMAASAAAMQRNRDLIYSCRLAQAALVISRDSATLSQHKAALHADVRALLLLGSKMSSCPCIRVSKLCIIVTLHCDHAWLGSNLSEVS